MEGWMSPPPDFIIIGAMKCATSTLHAQLARQPGVFMTTPKEPSFFSDDDVHARGADWYRSLFAGAPPGAMRGESSTHYTKLPAHPRTIERLRAYGAEPRLIYIMRDPIDRLVSQYIHEWTESRIRGSIDHAVETFPPLVDYGRYAMQLAPWIEAFGRERILLVFFERLRDQPEAQLQRVCRFLGLPSEARWAPDLERDNVSGDRLRKSPVRDAIVNAPGLATIRKNVIPRAVRNRAKSLWQMRSRPAPSLKALNRLRRIYDEDLARLGAWTGLELTTERFAAVASQSDPDWVRMKAQGHAR
jgi:hypothetical protein